MTRRQLETGGAASCVLALAVLIASVLAGAVNPVLQAITTLLTSLLVLLAIEGVERYARTSDDWGVSVTKSRRRQFDREELH